VARTVVVILEARHRIQQPEVRVTPGDPWELHLALIRPVLKRGQRWSLGLGALFALAALVISRVLGVSFPDHWSLMLCAMCLGGCFAHHVAVFSFPFWIPGLSRVGTATLMMTLTGAVFGFSLGGMAVAMGPFGFLYLAAMLIPPTFLLPRNPDIQRWWLGLEGLEEP
jgi:hypothetical protein